MGSHVGPFFLPFVRSCNVYKPRAETLREKKDLVYVSLEKLIRVILKKNPRSEGNITARH